MDIVPYVAAAQQFVIDHPLADTLAAFMLGGMAANPIACADAAANVVNKIPPLKYLIKSNWPAISSFIDRFKEKFGADVTAAEPSPASPAPEPPKPA